MSPKNPAAVALGSIRSARKAASSRANGAKGGRPEGVTETRPRRTYTYTIQVQADDGLWVTAPGEASGWTRAQAQMIVQKMRVGVRPYTDVRLVKDATA